MSIHHKYNEIYHSEITSNSEAIIISYKPLTDQWVFNAYSHTPEIGGVEKLASLMRKNLLFYCYGEEEIVNFYNSNKFSSLEIAAKYAYSQRLPKRKSQSDGLPGEVLLDLLVQLYNPNTYKLAVRTIFRQNDNKEIKGYDLTYFSIDNEKTTLWLGQSKLGSKDYCKQGINSDLIKKYTDEYLSEQLFFVCDKRMELTEDAKNILSVIDNINIICLSDSIEERNKKLFEYFDSDNISVKIPCLLAYEKKDIYSDISTITAKISMELKEVQKYFNSKTYNFSGFNPEIVIYIFPIEDINKLRNIDGGFYDGLY